MPIAMIPRNGKPIAVIKNPKLAIKNVRTSSLTQVYWEDKIAGTKE